MSKYQPLGDFLSRQEDDVVELSLDEVARLVGELPESAFRQQSFWANTIGHVQGAAWRVVRFDPDWRRVRFVRSGTDGRQDQVRERRPDVQHAWLVRGANVGGENLVPNWLREGYVSVSAQEVRRLDPGPSRSEIAEYVAEDHPEGSYGARMSLTGLLDAFLNRLREDDLVVTVDGDDVYVGHVASPPYWTDKPVGRDNRRRRVRWANPRAPLSRHRDLSEVAQGKLKGQRTIIDLTPVVAEFAKVAVIRDELDEERLPVAEASAEPRFPGLEATDALAHELHVPRGWLREAVALLRERGQVVFDGPPGTGKTYVARAVAEHVAGDYVQLVQFHPAYSYEHFFEGLRPRVVDNALAFEVMPGPFRRLVDAAVKNTSQPYVLVVDELNRANLASVFGELYYLLEYREQSVELLYSPEESFTLPKNVFVIGTMNTGDRSITAVDAAMRRRFSFLSFSPDDVPVKGVLRRWLEARGIDGSGPADLLDKLNERLRPDELAVGPSYFMDERVTEPDWLDRLWRTSVLPLLRDAYAGQVVDFDARFGLGNLAEAVGWDLNGTAAVDDGAASGEPGP